MIIEVRRVSFQKPEPQPLDSSKTAAFFRQYGSGKDAIEAVSRQLRQSMHQLGYSSIDLGENPATPWGEMEIRKEKMNRTERHHSFRHRYSYVGPFRYPHRALLPISDGRAWHHRAAGKGGTLVIDCSGSMSLSTKQILDVLKNNPLATVAIYHGIEGGRFTNERGRLTILAASNRYCDNHNFHDSDYGLGNVVDLPALKWLAHQERPRIWVCDGGVTGIADRPVNPAMLVQVAEIITRAGIHWVTSLKQLPKGHL